MLRDKLQALDQGVSLRLQLHSGRIQLSGSFGTRLTDMTVRAACLTSIIEVALTCNARRQL